MINHRRILDDGQTGRGSANSVRRYGNTILRPIGEWSTAIRDLLKHLASVGFKFSPRFLETDKDRGMEVLTYIEGEVSMRPWPSCLLSTDGVSAIGRMLRDYHLAVKDYRPCADAKWRAPDAKWQSGMIIRHGDPGPWSMVWQSGKLTGLIGWDFAEPGYEIEDVAQAAWYCVPLRPPEKCLDAGIRGDSQSGRMTALCNAYCVGIETVKHALVQLQKREISRTLRLGQMGIEPWKTFLERGDVDDMKAEKQWLCENLKASAQQSHAPDAVSRVGDA